MLADQAAELRIARQGVPNPAPHKRKRSNGKDTRGRKSTYTEELAGEIIERITMGESLTNICRDAHMPRISTVFSWEGLNATFAERLARARRYAVEAWGHQIIDIADKAATSKGGVNKARLQTDVRRWLMSKLRPERYGERVVAVLEGGDKPIQTNDLATLELARWLAFKLQGGVDALGAISDGPKLLESQACGRSDVGQDVG